MTSAITPAAPGATRARPSMLAVFRNGGPQIATDPRFTSHHHHAALTSTGPYETQTRSSPDRNTSNHAHQHAAIKKRRTMPAHPGPPPATRRTAEVNAVGLDPLRSGRGPAPET
ncbi:hypothetical protein GCM10009839_93940 [Catenulispora yoronensis]|uniref:Uncharacterized protein n=1 Tax=Catenulispora yoronensis TaxID=450799 RepID=A0ABN2VP62_9ACTN